MRSFSENFVTISPFSEVVIVVVFECVCVCIYANQLEEAASQEGKKRSQEENFCVVDFAGLNQIEENSENFGAVARSSSEKLNPSGNSVVGQE